MGRPLTVSRAGRFTKRMNFIEELRSALPISQYIAVLHEAAITGKIPKFDRFGQRLPDSAQDQPPLDEPNRGKLLQYLIDKSMPSYRQQDAPLPTAGDTANLGEDTTDADFTLLSSDQLREIATAATRLADDADEPGPDGSTQTAQQRAKLASPEAIPGPTPG